MRLLDKHRKMAALYDDWMRLKNKGINFTDMIKKEGYCTCAVYGNGAIGKQIYEALRSAGITVLYFMDRSLPYLKGPIPVYGPDEEVPAVDMIIISLVEHEEPVRKLLRRKMEGDIWTITELIRDMQRME